MAVTYVQKSKMVETFYQNRFDDFAKTFRRFTKIISMILVKGGGLFERMLIDMRIFRRCARKEFIEN